MGFSCSATSAFASKCSLSACSSMARLSRRRRSISPTATRLSVPIATIHPDSSDPSMFRASFPKSSSFYGHPIRIVVSNRSAQSCRAVFGQPALAVCATGAGAASVHKHIDPIIFRPRIRQRPRGDIAYLDRDGIRRRDCRKTGPQRPSAGDSHIGRISLRNP